MRVRTSLAEKRAASAGMMAAAAPAPAPAKALPAAPAAEPRNDNMKPPSAMTETVTVEAGTTSVIETVQTPERKAKDEAAQNEVRKESHAERTGAAGAIARSKHGLAFNRRRTIRSWQLCQAVTGGQWRNPMDAFRRRRSAALFRLRQNLADDSGGENVVFRALAANDSDIWVGGAAGALYHSSDAGQHWIRVYPAATVSP